MVNTQPLVTIAIPTYNRSEKYFRESFESVLNQSYRNLEIIVADNASSKIDIEAIVNSYSDERVKYHRHQENIGLAANWTWCVRAASGEWINIFHDDDIMMPDNVLNAIATAELYPQVVFQYSDAISINQNGKELRKQWFRSIVIKDHVHPGRLLLESLLISSDNVICPPSVFVRRSIYLENMPFSKFPILTCDLNMWLKILKSNVPSLVRNDFGVKYRLHAQQDTSKSRFKGKARLYYLLEFGRLFPSLPLSHKIIYLQKILESFLMLSKVRSGVIQLPTLERTNKT